MSRFLKISIFRKFLILFLPIIIFAIVHNKLYKSSLWKNLFRRPYLILIHWKLNEELIRSLFFKFRIMFQKSLKCRQIIIRYNFLKVKPNYYWVLIMVLKSIMSWFGNDSRNLYKKAVKQIFVKMTKYRCKKENPHIV